MFRLPRRPGRIGPVVLSVCLLALSGCGGDAADPVVDGAVVAKAKAPQGGEPQCVPFLDMPVFMGQVPSPTAVLGFPIGSQEVTVEQVGRYLAAVDAASTRVVTGSAGESVQGRPLHYAIVGREANVSKAGLDKLRKAIGQLMDPSTTPQTAASLAASTPGILWVAGNVHGNEESGADAALRVLYELADRNDCVASRILDNAVVVILPVQNPDGREAGTRRNVYGFDMNRDWFARTQPETDGKLELMRQYPPQLLIDAHEFGSKGFFFPPNADPVYHEVPDHALDWINRLYSPSIAAEFDRQKLSYFHGAPYDLFAAQYGDTVATIGFHAAGMTFEKYNGDTIQQRTYEHFVATWTSLFAAASDKPRLLEAWQRSHAQARDQGASGSLEPNALNYDGKTLYQTVPAGLAVRHYFLLDDPGRARELALLVRRLQRMDVQVWRLQAPLTVTDFRAYGSATPAAVTMPAGTYWVPMAQARKHWIQAMLHEDSWIPTSVSYDVTAWSNPLLMNLAGGASGMALSPTANLVPPVAAPGAPGLPAGAPKVGLFEMPGSTASFESAGSIRHLFERVWGVPYANVTAADIQAGLPGIDVLLVPDGYASAGLKALGSKGQRALAAWVERGGRYVGYRGGTELGVKAGVSSAVLQSSNTGAPGTLVRVRLEPGSPLASGIGAGPDGPAAWIMYTNDDSMSAGLGVAVATFPAPGEPDFHTSGLAIGIDELAGTAAVVDEAVGSGRSIVFSFDPNFRAWTEGTQRILWNALYGPDPAAPAVAASSTERTAAAERAARAASALPDLGKAIRIVVTPEDSDATRALLQRYGAEFRELRRPTRTVFLVENRAGLSWEEHPFILDLSRELSRQLTPLSFSVP